MYLGDYENDGGAIDLHVLWQLLHMYEAGIVDAAYIKTRHSLTTPQGADLDELLATMPGLILTALNATARARWADTVYAVLYIGSEGNTGFNSEALARAALGTD